MKTRWLVGLLMALAGWSAVQAPVQAATTPIVVGESFTLTSTVLQQERPVHVYLPPDYQNNAARYPVLFLLDGGPQQDFVHVAGVAALAADFRHLREFIVIGIESLDRYHELVPVSRVPKEREQLPTAGGADDFRRFLATELLPYVAQHYRISEERVLMGESLAGLFVVETFLKQPSLFQGYIAISPSLWWDEQSLVSTAPGFSKRADYRGKRLYLSIANEGGTMQDGMNQLLHALKAEAPTTLWWQYVPMPTETHGTIYHPALHDAVRKLFGTATAPWPTPLR